VGAAPPYFLFECLLLWGPAGIAPENPDGWGEEKFSVGFRG